MPTYTYRCPVCGREATALRTIKYRDDGPRCNHTPQGPIPMQRVPDAPMGVVRGPAVPKGGA